MAAERGCPFRPGRAAAVLRPGQAQGLGVLAHLGAADVGGRVVEAVERRRRCGVSTWVPGLEHEQGAFKRSSQLSRLSATARAPSSSARSTATRRSSSLSRGLPGGTIFGVSWWSSVKRWATSSTPLRYEIFHCPKCGRAISRYAMAPGPGRMGLYTRWTEREILARCPVDGWPPWNTPAVRKLEGDEEAR